MKSLIFLIGWLSAAALGLILIGLSVVALVGGEALVSFALLLGSAVSFSQVLVIGYVARKVEEEDEAERREGDGRADEVEKVNSNLAGTPWEKDPGYTRS